MFYMLPPRENTSYPGAFNQYYYDLPINHLPGIHWCAHTAPMRGSPARGQPPTHVTWSCCGAERRPCRI